MSERLFTSESVTEGHPDKLADRVSDSILDHILAEDPTARVACETLVTTGLVLIAGEITTETYVEIPDIVRETLDEVGYSDPGFGIDAKTCAILTTIDRQTEEIAQGVDPGGAGDQGMMFGYASDETEAHMPAPILYSHRLTQGLARLRHSGELPWLRPDGKAQVTVAYRDDRPVRIETVVVSAQHGPDISRPQIEEAIREHLLRPLLPEELYDPAAAHIHINPTGSFMTGGPQGDAGLTGRKIIVDTYGGMGRHGGGAFSGKDATKVDRSGAYAARWAARTVVAAGLARRCEIQIAYAIGVADPVSVWVDTQGTGSEPDHVISKAVGEVFDFRPRGIIQDLGLRSPLYAPTSAYGHFGRASRAETRLGCDVVLFPWERLDRVEALRAAI